MCKFAQAAGTKQQTQKQWTDSQYMITLRLQKPAAVLLFQDFKMQRTVAVFCKLLLVS